MKSLARSCSSVEALLYDSTALLSSLPLNLSTGINLVNMAKMLKCAGNEDIITIKAEDQPDNVQFFFETPGEPSP